MASICVPFEMPCGIEVAVHRLGSACKRDGYDGDCAVIIKDGVATSVTISKKDGEIHSLVMLRNDWHEFMEVDDGR